MRAGSRFETAELTPIEAAPAISGKSEGRRFPTYGGVLAWLLTPASIVLLAWLLSHLIYL